MSSVQPETLKSILHRVAHAYCFIVDEKNADAYAVWYSNKYKKWEDHSVAYPLFLEKCPPQFLSK